MVAVCVAAGFSHAADVLKVGTNAAYPPFEFIDEQNKIAGFDMDLIDALSKKVGFEYKIVNMSFDGLIPALKAGKIDAVAAAMSATPERIKAVSFTKPYYTTENLFIKQAKNGDLTSKQNLEGKKIAVQLGTVQEIAARSIKGVKVMANEDIFAAIMALKNGKVDAVLVDSSIGYGYLNKNKDLAEFLKEPDGSEGFSIAFDKDKHTDLIAKINQAVEELKNDGTYDKLLEKYNLK
ncbi:basic amino acid ABC transporter substrate-binding protein [Campylobacter hyointestinalis subsp. lawsonii]|nr:basic amino acid ABC transporter substrate-binding protein [Campylobacter hyointestinalis subsp. lawsonii]RAZ38669.1 basic amino acid ABC transporter substrate-binding protein [Campylobacter hyointestinalis subsp. lawsonii]RAZ51174.1 basic amino acid ABC transporter substrate-binding protein [Campylobacter hyointestinalis subsp. lawsonii]